MLRIASVDGRLLLILAGLFAVLAAASHDAIGAFAGVVAAGAGALELYGVQQLRAGWADGVRHLVRSQLVLMGAVLAYVTLRWLHVSPDALQALIDSEAREQFAAMGVSEAEIVPMLEKAYRTAYVFAAIITLFYQGGMALFYHRRRAAIDYALNEGLVEPATESES